MKMWHQAENKYNEDFLLAAGVNIMISDKLCLCDLLRIHFDQELRQELFEEYLL